jgi:dipeptidyl-peptidase-4
VRFGAAAGLVAIASAAAIGLIVAGTAAAAAAGTGAGAGAGAGAAAAAPPRLTIDRLYSLPWLIGTKPRNPQWSPDSRELAFLWNDDGGNFYDVWVADRTTGQPIRVTSMPRPERPIDPGKDVAKLAQVAASETDSGVSELLWAPDGRHLLFIFHGGIYRVLPGANPERLTQVCAGASDMAVANDTGLLAYLCDDSLRATRSSGAAAPEITLYAPGKESVSVESFVWSGDGRRIAFVEADASKVPVRGIPDYLGAETRLVPVKRPFPGEPSESRRVGIVAATGGEPRWIALGGDPLDQIFSLSWSPDAKTLLIDKSDLYIKDRRLLLADADHGSTRTLLREADPNNVTAEWWSDWAPDGKGIYFISDRDNDYHVYYQSLSGAAPRRITTGNWAVFSATIAAKAQALFFVSNANRPEERQVYRVPLAGGAPVRVTQAAGAHLPLLSPDGKLLADLYSSDIRPPDLYIQESTLGAGRERVRQITHSPLPEFARYRWVAAKYVSFPNVNDGTLLHARLTLPPDFDPHKKYPAILGSVYSNTVHNEWGGRIYHPTWGIDQFLAQQGYVIMNVDISGSSGYGKLFRQRIREDYGGVDVDDLYSGVRYLIAQGFVDAQRVGIWGSSYGGLLTTMSLFRRPGVYRAGVAGAPATSLFHAQTGEMRTMMAPQDHAQQYARASAFLQSGGLSDHLLIIHGMRDDTVLFKDSVTLEQRLILQGGDVDFVMLPDAPHGWDTRGLAQTRYAFHKLYDYFERYMPSARP